MCNSIAICLCGTMSTKNKPQLFRNSSIYEDRRLITTTTCAAIYLSTEHVPLLGDFQDSVLLWGIWAQFGSPRGHGMAIGVSWSCWQPPLIPSSLYGGLSPGLYIQFRRKVTGATQIRYLFHMIFRQTLAQHQEIWRLLLWSCTQIRVVLIITSPGHMEVGVETLT